MREDKPEDETTLERLERYLYGHSLRLELPGELVDGARGLISDKFLSKLPTSLTVPLAQEDDLQGKSKELADTQHENTFSTSLRRLYPKN